MQPKITLHVNGENRQVDADPETPLLYVLRNDFGLKGPKFGCGMEQCNACKVLIDGTDVPSCKVPIHQVQNTKIITLEGLRDGDNLHPLQEAFLEEQAAQCGYCTAGMIIAAQGLLNRTRYPSDAQIREALNDNLCRCGVYDRVRRAIKLRIGRPIWDPIYELRQLDTPIGTDHHTESTGSLRQTPDLDAWIRINPDETITVFTGKVEIGQGIKTAVAMIAAEELDIDISRIHVVTADTAQTPDEGMTAGSMSVQMSGSAIRHAAAEARYALLSLAYEHLESQSPIDALIVTDGVITDPVSGRQVTYGQLMGGKRFARQASGVASPKPASAYRIVGTAAKRIDLRAKVTGGGFIQDMELPGMIHGRVVRPPGYHARLVSVDIQAARQLPGVIDVIRDGDFLGVLAEREAQAVRARDALAAAAIWEKTTALPDQRRQYDHLLSQPADSVLIKNGEPIDDPIPPVEAPADAVQTLTATYLRPFQMHGSLAPSTAVAQFSDGTLTVWSHTQWIFNLRAAIAHALHMDVDAVRVIHAESAGCYGHNGADDAGLDAALLARAAPGRPVMLKWMRSDEHCWEPYGSAMVIQLQASLDQNGRVCDWNHDTWSYTHSTRPRQGAQGSGLLAAWHLAERFTPPKPALMKRPQAGGHRNADPKYAFPRQRVVKHFVATSPLRVSAMRSLGAYANLFAIESLMDELAFAAGADPVAFRLRHLDDPRAAAVIEAAAEKADWQPQTRPAGEGYGRGVAFAHYENALCYAAVIVDVHVDADTGVIRLERGIIAADAGQIVNPDGLSNQLEGGLVQAASWTLYEQVTYDADGITSFDWETYPILRFANAPVIETVLLNRPGAPSLGSGEATQGPTPAAIANAVFDAVGVRLREIPFTPERVKAALRSGQVTTTKR